MTNVCLGQFGLIVWMLSDKCMFGAVWSDGLDVK